MPLNANTTQNIKDADEKHTGTGSDQLAGGWTRHSPKGGATLGGKYFKGGQFIPDTDLSNASPEELQALNDAIENGKNTEKTSPKGDVEVEEKEGKGNKEEQKQIKAEPIKDTLYLVSDGHLIGDDGLKTFGDVVLKNNVERYPNLIASDVRVASILKTKRIDVISPVYGKVVSLRSNSGLWPHLDNTDADVNVMDTVKRDKNIEIEETGFDAYAPLSSLPDSLKLAFNVDLLNPPSAEIKKQAVVEEKVEGQNMSLREDDELIKLLEEI
jgi:hypothetical protein